MVFFMCTLFYFIARVSSLKAPLQANCAALKTGQHHEYDEFFFRFFSFVRCLVKFSSNNFKIQKAKKLKQSKKEISLTNDILDMASLKNRPGLATRNKSVGTAARNKCLELATRNKSLGKAI